MIKFLTLLKHLLIFSSIFLALLLINPVIADSIYTPEVLYTIPWGGDHGDEMGGLSSNWNEAPETPEGWATIEAPDSWAINDSAELVIADHMRINKYDESGNFIAMFDYRQNNKYAPEEIAIANEGHVLYTYFGSTEIMPGHQFVQIYTLVLLNANLGLIVSVDLPPMRGYVNYILPSDSDYFYILYTTHEEAVLEPSRYGVTWDERILYKLHYNGLLEPPEVLWSGYSDEPEATHYCYITPDGQVCNRVTDDYGYTYKNVYYNDVERYDPNLALDFALTIEDDPDWSEICDFANYHVLHTGDIYTLHATDEGAVLTKYELNLPPISNFFVVTQMPYIGSSPAAIEFDACGSYDPNEGDELTYEWDFDGDLVFSEPVHDSYTGDPVNPTHNYTSDYTGPVNLRVTDSHSASSTYTWTIVVDII